MIANDDRCGGGARREGEMGREMNRVGGEGWWEVQFLGKWIRMGYEPRDTGHERNRR